MKIILLAALCSSALMAESFESFLERSITNSPLLKASKLQIKQSEASGSLLVRYKNPNLELEASSFNPEVGDSDIGYRASIAQPIRLWGVSGNKSTLVEANNALAQANYTQAKAAFTRDLSLQYTNYSQNALLTNLALQEQELAMKIFDISTARYDAGTTSRGVMLQAKVDFNMAKARYQTQTLVEKRSYYTLLENAAIDEEIELETGYRFTTNSKKGENPEIAQLKYTQKSALAKAKVNTNKIEWMSLMAEYENEPQQDIFRFGASFPLAFFNTKSQEKTIAKLESKRSVMLEENVQNRLNILIKRLEYEAISLEKLIQIDTAILEDEKELLKMYEEGYKIANVNLLALQDAKRRLIETQERLIKISIERDRNAIAKNYLQGNYND